MDQQPIPSPVNPLPINEAIASATLAATHRRDHVHPAGESCHPHVVEIVDLGPLSCVVCHCCGYEHDFCPEGEANRCASEHRSSN